SARWPRCCNCPLASSVSRWPETPSMPFCPCSPPLPARKSANKSADKCSGSWVSPCCPVDASGDLLLQERFGRAPRGFPNAKFHKNATAQEKPGLHRRPRLQRRESLSGIGHECRRHIARATNVTSLLRDALACLQRVRVRCMTMALGVPYHGYV